MDVDGFVDSWIKIETKLLWMLLEMMMLFSITNLPWSITELI